METDWEELMEKNKKLMKQIDKLTRQLDDAKQTIQAMKSESAENKALKVGSNEEITTNCVTLARERDNAK